MCVHTCESHVEAEADIWHLCQLLSISLFEAESLPEPVAD